MSTISAYILNTTILGYVATLKVRAIFRDPDNTAFCMFCNTLLLLLPTNSFIVTSRSLVSRFLRRPRTCTVYPPQGRAHAHCHPALALMHHGYESPVVHVPQHTY